MIELSLCFVVLKAREKKSSSEIYISYCPSPDDVQEAYNLIQDLLPTTPQVIKKIFNSL